MSIATVIGPTPPGTGVIHPATSEQPSSKSSETFQHYIVFRNIDIKFTQWMITSLSLIILAKAFNDETILFDEGILSVATVHYRK